MKKLFYFSCFLALSLSTFMCSQNLVYHGQISNFHSFERYDFVHNNSSSIIVKPRQAAKGNPWIWRARFFGHEPQTDVALLKKGFHVVYTDVSDLFGSPKAVKIWDEFYDYLRKEYDFAPKVVLEGFSRGGLIIYNWASENPQKVACIYADAPVCDLKSWPGVENKKMMSAYGFTKDEFFAFKGNPVDNLKSLADARVPILHVVGDADKVVPVKENTAIIEQRYKELGGHIRVIHKKGIGHHPHSLKDPTPIVEFILKHIKQ